MSRNGNSPSFKEKVRKRRQRNMIQKALRQHRGYGPHKPKIEDDEPRITPRNWDIIEREE